MKIKYLLIFFLLGISSAYAKSIKLEHYSEDQGLSHNSVRHIVQDDKGVLWFGTFGGVNSYDGNTFTVFHSKTDNPKSINNDDITALAINDKTEELWIGTRNGLTCHNLKTNQFYTYFPERNNPNSLPEEEIRALLIDKFGRVWVGTKNQGLCYYNKSTDNFTKIDIKGFFYVKAIYADTDGNIWVGSNKTGGIAQIKLNNDGSVKKIKTYTLTISNSEEINPYINFIYQDNKSDIFAGTREGLYKLDKINDSFIHFTIPDPSIRNLLGPYFNCVAQAPDGKYWVGTLGGLIVCNHLENISTGNYDWYYSVLSEESSLIDNSISALYFDNTGILWIGTENGLDKYDSYKNQFKNIKDISFLINDKIPRISGIAKTYDGKLIVTTHDNGLFLGTNNKFTTLQCENKKIASIYSDDGKVFYCGLWDGSILIYNYITNKFATIKSIFNETPAFAFAKMKDGTVFVGTHGNGAIMLNPADLSFKRLLPDVFNNMEINQAITDKNDILWVTSETGIIKLDIKNNKTQTYTHNPNNPESLSTSVTKDIKIAPNDVIWVASRDGLNYYDAKKDAFIPISSPDELREDWITDLRIEKNGNLWLNLNNNRVGKYNPTTKKLDIYHINSGNRLDIFSNRGFLLYNDSLIYLPGENGIIYFSTYISNNYSTSEPPFITEVKVQNKKILPGNTINGKVILKENINYSKKLELDYKNRNFLLSFSSPSYENVKLNKFQYMLEGFDKDWITVDNNSRNIQYTNLYPGKYNFKIKTKNSSEQWSNPASYQIIIKPPFWLTYKFILLVIVILSFITYISQKQIRKSLKLKHELELEKVKREKDEKLNDEKLRFFTNISHELRTPISLILGPAKQLQEKKNISDKHKNKINLILNNSNRLSYLVNQLLEFRKAQTGTLQLKVSETNILQTTKNIFKSFKNLATDKKINFTFITEQKELTGWIDKDKYDKILYNLLSNAIKFTNKYGNIDLFLGLKGDNYRQLVVEISDDGIGIPPKSQKKIFSRFYQVEQTKEENTGSGIGLSLVKTLVNIHKSTINVVSEPEKGSSFTIEIPIDKESYDNHEILDITNTINDEELLNVNVNNNNNKPSSIKEKILIIDDNTELREFIADYLSDSYKVFQAENGQKGLLLCLQEKPILCVADIKMPVLNGFEFCIELKKDVIISHIPVILLTALSDNDNIIKGYKLGADGYIVKPFDPTLLKTRIENIIKTRLELKAKFSEDIESKVTILSHSPADEEFMNKLSEIIEDNIDNSKLKIEILCKKMGTSSSKLYRKIKELTDMSPNEFIRTLRLKKSAQMLKTKKYHVSEVSYFVGFNDPLYFSRCFKKQFGISPSSLL